MSTANKRRVAAIDGWFAADASVPHLLGSRCRECGTYFFPRESVYCRNPACAGDAFDEVALSRRGKLWSVTDNRYKPPAPYVATEPFEPYGLAAVELAREQMVVLGQLVRGVDVSGLKVGMEMELVVDTLYEDEETEYLIWKWKPVLP